MSDTELAEELEYLDTQLNSPIYFNYNSNPDGSTKESYIKKEYATKLSSITPLMEKIKGHKQQLKKLQSKRDFVVEDTITKLINKENEDIKSFHQLQEAISKLDKKIDTIQKEHNDLAHKIKQKIRNKYLHEARRLAFGFYPHICNSCGCKDKPFETHHKDGNWMNNLVKNLEILCYLCHSNSHFPTEARKVWYEWIWGDNDEPLYSERYIETKENVWVILYQVVFNSVVWHKRLICRDVEHLKEELKGILENSVCNYEIKKMFVRHQKRKEC